MRLIPAHAGKTPQRLRPSGAPRAHPRSRGENTSQLAANSVDGGSSPLTRGKRARPLQRRNAVRLIPAHAGKTARGIGRKRQRTAHPRSRGENLRLHSDLPHARGSSPLTRGKLRRRARTPGSPRLIPAHAGKTAITSAYKHSVAAHPRSRGENNWPTVGVEPSSGSSPLTRGKRRQSPPYGL